MKISALILTLNEEEMISDCIKQLSFADEIVILDQNSKDRTLEIAKQCGAIVMQKSTGEFDKDRNLLRNNARGEWLLYLDADERLTTDTQAEINNLIHNGKKSAYYFPRQNYILGKWLKHGGWWPDYVPRLFKKADLLSWEGKVHESPTVRGQFGYAKTPIKHLTARSVTKMLDKSTKWAKIEAGLYAKANAPKVTKIKVIKAMTREFILRYFIKFGLLDGYIGLIQSLFQTWHKAIILVYLWEIQNKTEEHLKEFDNE